MCRGHAARAAWHALSPSYRREYVVAIEDTKKPETRKKRVGKTVEAMGERARIGMFTSDVRPGERVKNVSVTEDTLSVDLLDGRTIVVPLAWYPRLLHATPAQRKNWRLAGAGYGIHWPDVDEDLSTEGLLRGAPAPYTGALAKV